MLKTNATFGIPSDDIEATRERVEALFGEELEGVSSDTWGLYYTTNTWDRDNVVSVFRNYIPDTGDPHWFEKDHKQFPLLLSTNKVPNFEEVRVLVLSDKQLAAVLIKQRELER